MGELFRGKLAAPRVDEHEGKSHRADPVSAKLQYRGFVLEGCVLNFRVVPQAFEVFIRECLDVGIPRLANPANLELHTASVFSEAWPCGVLHHAHTTGATIMA